MTPPYLDHLQTPYSRENHRSWGLGPQHLFLGHQSIHNTYQCFLGHLSNKLSFASGSPSERTQPGHPFKDGPQRYRENDGASVLAPCKGFLQKS